MAAFRRRGGGSDGFEASFSKTAAALSEHLAATADTAAKVREGMVIVRILDGIVQQRFRKVSGMDFSFARQKSSEEKEPPTP